MGIVRAELFELSLPLVEPFVISGGTMASRRSLIVILHDDAGHAGYGECPPFELPFYSEETLAGARDLIERVLLPRVTGRDFDGPLPEAVDAALREGVRGNWFARAALETAAWDLEAVQRGYRRVKIKVAPGWDAVAVAAARTGMAGTTLPLTVDANGAYEWPRDEAALRALDDAGLLYIEQPLHPDELVGRSRLAEALRTPLCLDETLRDARAASQIVALHGPKVWNIKVHRVGGLTEVCRIYRLAAEYGAKLWAGTMPESGIGSQAALAAASLPLFVYPSDLEPSARWFGRNGDVIKLTMGRGGRMAVPHQSCGRLLDPGRFRLLTAPILFGAS